MFIGKVLQGFFENKRGKTVERELTTEQGENGSSTIRRLLVRIDARTDRMDTRLLNLENRVGVLENQPEPAAPAAA